MELHTWLGDLLPSATCKTRPPAYGNAPLVGHYTSLMTWLSCARVSTISRSTLSLYLVSSMSSSLKRLATEDGSVSPPPTKRKISAVTTSMHMTWWGARQQYVNQHPDNAVANFFTPISQKEPEKTAWRVVDSSLLACQYDKYNPHLANDKLRKIAAFDFVRAWEIAAVVKSTNSRLQGFHIDHFSLRKEVRTRCWRLEMVEPGSL